MDNQLTYDSWKQDHLKYLSTMAGKQVIVTFSGGKDSSLALYLMARAAGEFGFSCEAHGAAFPRHVLDEGEKQRFDDFWGGQGTTLVWHDVPIPDEALDQAVESGTSPCKICTRTKKAVLLASVRHEVSDLNRLVLVMGYSLWDLTSATLENILNSRARAEGGGESGAIESRLMETAQRFYPWLQFKGGPAIFKPLLLYNDETIQRAINDFAIPVGRNSCRHTLKRPKRRFAEYYREAGLQFDFEKVRDLWQSTLPLPPASQFESMGIAEYLGTHA